MDAIVQAIFLSSAALLLFYNGLLVDRNALRGSVDRRLARQFIALSFVNYLVIPAATFGLVAALNISREMIATLLILSALPCAPFVPPLARRFGESGPWPVLVFLGFSLLSLPMLLVLLGLLRSPLIGSDFLPDWNTVSVAVGKYLSIVYVPFGLGIVMKGRWTLAVSRREAITGKVAMYYALFAVALFVAARWRDAASIQLRDQAAFMLFEILCLACAWLAGSDLGGPLATRLLSAAVRNFALALAFSSCVLPHTDVPMYLTVFSLGPIILPILISARRR